MVIESNSPLRLVHCMRGLRVGSASCNYCQGFFRVFFAVVQLIPAVVGWWWGTKW